VVKGVDIFRERFRAFEGSFILIGGAACDEWFATQGIKFRATKDLDIVLIVEVVDGRFVAAIRQFVDDGGYEIRQRTDGSPILYRFARPTDGRFPFMLEFFSRNQGALDLKENQNLIPFIVEPDLHSLSAILLDDAYYALIQSQQEVRDGVQFATVAALIPLKARAWLDLAARRANEEKIDSKDITKHRTDVFRLAATLPGEPGPILATSITADLARFLTAFPETSSDWPAILASLTEIFGNSVRPGALRSAIQTFFRLSA